MREQNIPANRVLGKVVRYESGAGVEGLIVTIYQLNKAPSARYASDSLEPSGYPDDWIRLGSSATGPRGGFALSYSDDKPDGAGLTGPRNLLVVVSTPDGECNCGGDSRSRVATCMRRNAGTIETFLISVDEARLRDAGFRAWRTSDVERAISHRRQEAERQKALSAESRRLMTERLEEVRHLQRVTNQKFERFLAALSTVPPEEHRLPHSRHVPRRGDVFKANAAAIRSGIEQRFNGKVRSGTLTITKEQLEHFHKQGGQIGVPLSATLLKVLIPWADQPGINALSLSNAIATSCRTGVEDECVNILKGEAAGTDGAGSDGHHQHESQLAQPAEQVNGDLLEGSDVPTFIDLLAHDMTSPESAPVFGLRSRATLTEVNDGLTTFEPHSGPADVPATYDFHRLQIAFEHVWQELFDANMEQSGKELYKTFVELGLDPNEYLSDGTLHITKDVIDAVMDSIAGVADAEYSATTPEPTTAVVATFEISPEQWAALNGEHQNELISLAAIIRETEESYDGSLEGAAVEGTEKGIAQSTVWKARRAGKLIIEYADQRLNSPGGFDKWHKLLTDLKEALKQPFRFAVYAADQYNRSVNFGIVTTYRQHWVPETYQVGKLTKTIPLAPKEVRRFSKKTSIRTSRAEKEVQNHLQLRKSESAETSRAETVIVEKALAKTNFQLSAKGGVNLGIARVSGATSFGQSAAEESQETKREFREAVFKAAEEYKTERTMEITFSTSEDASAEESGEISNPNDEITVTYLFYELQRRYKVNEKIQQVTPVVLVAQEFPKPSDIDEGWIIANDWILRRVILDDSFVPAMNYLATKVVGDEVAHKETFKNLVQQRRMVEDIKEDVVAIRESVGRHFAALQGAMARRAAAIEEEESESFFEETFEAFAGSDDRSPEALRVLEEAARNAYEREAKLEKELQGRLERETTALNALTETYTKNLAEHLNRKAQISRLQVHIKSNIMYYMQAIWSHEPPDQRFFRLHEVKVPNLAGNLTYTIETDSEAMPTPPDWIQPHKLIVKCELDASNIEYNTLAEVADLDNLLGFKGNYMMFPLKRANALTTFLMAPYFDDYLGLRDPDELGNWTLDEFTKYVCCLKHELSEQDFQELLPGLMEAFQHIVAAPDAKGQEIILPTDCLYVEALPGAHPILEDFKLAHRGVDVKKVQAEVRAMEFENLRAAARLFAGEREDPTIEKKVVVEGASTVVVPEP